jgi:hypothetical protein
MYIHQPLEFCRLGMRDKLILYFPNTETRGTANVLLILKGTAPRIPIAL